MAQKFMVCSFNNLKFPSKQNKTKQNTLERPCQKVTYTLTQKNTISSFPTSGKVGQVSIFLECSDIHPANTPIPQCRHWSAPLEAGDSAFWLPRPSWSQRQGCTRSPLERLSLWNIGVQAERQRAMSIQVSLLPKAHCTLLLLLRTQGSTSV